MEQTMIFTEGVSYKILSELYQAPSPNHIEKLKTLKDMIEEESQVYQIVEGMIDEWDAYKGDLTELKVDYARLFVGPFQLLAPPYASIYLDDKWEVMGKSTIDIIKCYEAAGLNMADHFKGPPDHISAVFEFLYYLSFQYQQTNDSTFEIRYHQFLQSYVTNWIPAFCKTLEQGAETTFYQNLSKITSYFAA